MKDTVLERIKAIIVFKDLSKRKFAELIGSPQTTINNLFLRGNEPNVAIVNSILNTFHDISAEWLLMGKGEMLKESPDPSNSNKAVNFNDHRSGKYSHNKPVSREEYEELRSKYLNSLEENIRLRNQIDEMREQKIKA